MHEGPSEKEAPNWKRMLIPGGIENKELGKKIVALTPRFALFRLMWIDCDEKKWARRHTTNVHLLFPYKNITALKWEREKAVKENKKTLLDSRVR